MGVIGVGGIKGGMKTPAILPQDEPGPYLSVKVFLYTFSKPEQSLRLAYWKFQTFLLT